MTSARTFTENNTHWYDIKGHPLYEIPKANGKGMKVPTLADARKLNLLPSVTTILGILDKPALTTWKIEQAVLAVLTTPRLPDEADDAYVFRVLHTEKVQDEEGKAARDRGTDIHAGLESALTGHPIADDLQDWIGPAVAAIIARGSITATEKILVGSGYAGKTDLIQEAPNFWTLWDFKSTRKLPEKASWPEHVLQLAAYAEAFWEFLVMTEQKPEGTKPIRTANCYISTVEPGKFVIFDNPEDWQRDYNEGFAPLMRHWQWSKNYKAEQ